MIEEHGIGCVTQRNESCHWQVLSTQQYHVCHMPTWVVLPA